MNFARKASNQTQTSPGVIVLLAELIKIVASALWFFFQDYTKDESSFPSKGEEWSSEKESFIFARKAEEATNAKERINNHLFRMREALKVLYGYVVSTQGILLAIPSLLYVTQNILQIAGAGNVSALTFQLLCQSKIVATAFISVWLLGTHISRRQWMCLTLLTGGIVYMTLMRSPNTRMIRNLPRSEQIGRGHLDISPFFRTIQNKSLLDLDYNIKTAASIVYCSLRRQAAFACLLSAAFLGSLAGVFLELRFKKTSSSKKLTQTSAQSLATYNVCLSFYSILTTLAVITFDQIQHYRLGYLEIQTNQTIMSYFRIGPWTITFILLKSCGGLLVSAVLRYNDSISKSE